MRCFNQKKVLISQRIDLIHAYNEQRDAIDQQLITLVEKMRGIPIVMPNVLKNPMAYLEYFKPDVILLSGGNDISPSMYEKSGQDYFSKNRDDTEFALLTYAVKERLSVLGICRGMQMLNVFFGGSLVSDLKQLYDNHVGSHHEIALNEVYFKDFKSKKYIVNSYHNQGVINQRLSKSLIPIAFSKDGVIEALQHVEYPMIGIQWHPEREESLRDIDVFIINKLMKE